MAKRWYVVQSKFNCEHQAAMNLKAQRFDVFFPVYKRERKGKPPIFLPLFPSYMFVGFDPKRNKRWRRIIHTRGVYDMIGCTEDHLRPVEEGYVEDLKKRIKTTSFDRAVLNLQEASEQMLSFTKGNQVLVEGGQYDGIVATYCSSSEKRVHLLLTLLNKPIRVSLSLSSIRLKRK